MTKNTFLALLVFFLVALPGCEDGKQKSSGNTLPKEAEKSMPASVLAEPDLALEAEIEKNAPELKKHLVLSKELEMKAGALTVHSIRWENDNVILNVEAVGTIWYTTYYRCTEPGFWSCKSGYDVDYRLKLNDKVNDRIHYLNYVDGHPPSYTEKDSNGAVVNRSRDKVITEAGVNYNLVFQSVPERAVRYFDFFESSCSYPEQYTWNLCGVYIKYFNEELKEQKDILDFFSKYKIAALSFEFLDKLYKKYEKYEDVQELIAAAVLEKSKQTNSIVKLDEFNKKFAKHHSLVAQSIEKIFSLTGIKDSVAGYEWFAANYGESKLALKAVERIHEIMYANAEKRDSIAAYNTFIITYPSAKQVKAALEKSIELERAEYTEFGFFSGSKKENNEKSARKLLIKAKQLERYPADNKLNSSEKVGYYIVVNRMYTLLQQEFDDTDATLRYLESQDFKDFTKELRSSLDHINATLLNIENNTSSIASYAKDTLAVARRGFEDASADRALSEYRTEKHRDWEQLMQYQNYGYR